MEELFSKKLDDKAIPKEQVRNDQRKQNSFMVRNNHMLIKMWIKRRKVEKTRNTNIKRTL